MKRYKIKVIICVFAAATFYGQETPRYLSDLYNNIFRSMANGMVNKPKLKVIDDKDYEEKITANYYPQRKTFEIGSSLIELTRKFGADSNNARAHIISHELAHLFLNHGYSSVIGTGFASVLVSKELKESKKNIEKNMGELEADQWASFYAYISGYQTNGIVPRLLDSIYKYYKLNDKKLSSYPPLKERKKFANDAAIKMKSMCEAFDFANIALMHRDYKLAIEIYIAIDKEGFKSREIISNLGTAYIFNSLSLMDSSETNFILPLQIDMNTRMRQNNERGLGNEDEVDDLLKDAIKLYRNAIDKDPDYDIAYLNLSIAYWLHKDLKDAEFYLDKTKSNWESNLFRAIVKTQSKDTVIKGDGLALLKKMDSEGYLLATENLRLLKNTNNVNGPKIPDWVTNLAKTKLPSNTEKEVNILDSTFKRTREIVCREVKGDITYRKWKYRPIEGNHVIAIQYLFNNNIEKSITAVEKKELVLSSQSVFEASSNTYCSFGDFIVIIDSKNKINYQIIKTQ